MAMRRSPGASSAVDGVVRTTSAVDCAFTSSSSTVGLSTLWPRLRRLATVSSVSSRHQMGCSATLMSSMWSRSGLRNVSAAHGVGPAHTSSLTREKGAWVDAGLSGCRRSYSFTKGSMTASATVLSSHVGGSLMRSESSCSSSPTRYRVSTFSGRMGRGGFFSSPSFLVPDSLAVGQAPARLLGGTRTVQGATDPAGSSSSHRRVYFRIAAQKGEAFFQDSAGWGG